MTHLNREPWLMAMNVEQPYGADGHVLPRTLDTPRAPSVTFYSGASERDMAWTDVVGPGRTTRYPCLYFMRWRAAPYDPEESAHPFMERRLHGGALPRALSVHAHWPPPIACKAADEALNEGGYWSAGAIKCTGHRQRGTGQGFWPRNKRDFACTACLRIATPPPPPPQGEEGGGGGALVNCFYALPLRLYRFMRYDESLAGLRRVREARKAEDERFKDGIAFGPGLSGRVAESAYWKDLSAPKPPRQRNRGGGGRRSGDEVARRNAALDAKLAALQKPEAAGEAAGKKGREKERECRAAVLGWQRERSAATITGKRSEVWGVPLRTLMDLGLAPERPTPVVEAVAAALGVGGLRSLQILKREAAERARMGTDDGTQPPPLAREDVATLLMPPFEPGAWEIKVRGQAWNTGRGGHLSRAQLRRLRRELVSRGVDPPTIDAVLGPEDVERLPPLTVGLVELLADLDLAATRSREPHTRGWQHRVVPVFLLPLILAAAAPADPADAKRWHESAWYQCVHVLASLDYVGQEYQHDVGAGPPSPAAEACTFDSQLLARAMEHAWPDYPTRRADAILAARYCDEINALKRVAGLEREYPEAVRDAVRDTERSYEEGKGAPEPRRIAGELERAREALEAVTAEPIHLYLRAKLAAT